MISKKSLASETEIKLQKSISLYKKGRTAEAKKLLQKLLKSAPKNVGVLNFYCFILFQEKNYPKLLTNLDKILSTIKNNPDLYNNRGIALQALGRHEEAVESYNDALKIAPKHVDTLSNISNSLRLLKRNDEALEHANQALSINPKHLNALLNKGNALQSIGKTKDALECYNALLEIDEKNEKALSNRANSLFDIGDFNQALMSCEQALLISPNNISSLLTKANILLEMEKANEALAICNLALSYQAKQPSLLNCKGRIFHVLGEYDKALNCFDKALKLDPNYVHAHNNRGLVLHDLKRYEPAIQCYDTALSIDCDNINSLLNKGNSQKELGHYTEALTNYNLALSLDPDNINTLNNKANVLRELGQIDQAHQNFNQALNLDPDNINANWNRSHLLLLTGHYSEAWPGYSWRKKLKKFSYLHRDYPQPVWSGEDLDGKTIYVYPEQGLGDTLEFLRYTRLLKKRGAKVIFSPQNSLHRFIETFIKEGEIQELLKVGDKLPAFDYHVPLMDLPGLFKTTLQTIPSYEGYFKTPHSFQEKWGERFANDRKFRLGIVYAGNANNTDDIKRSMDPSCLKVLADIENLSLYSLQVGRNEKEAEVFDQKVISLSDELTDFAETAGAISQLDLVISVDTSVAHLAGAMGIPAWIMLAKIPDWRWLLEGQDCAWYPNTKLYRQTESYNWQDVVTSIKQDLEVLIAEKISRNQ